MDIHLLSYRRERTPKIIRGPFVFSGQTCSVRLWIDDRVLFKLGIELICRVSSRKVYFLIMPRMFAREWMSS